MYLVECLDESDHFFHKFYILDKPGQVKTLVMGYTAIPRTNYSTEFLLSPQQTTTRSIGHQVYIVGAASEGASISLHNNSTDGDNDDKEATSLQYL